MPRWLVSYAQVLANSLVQLIIVAVVFVHSTVATARKMAAPASETTLWIYEDS